MDLDTVTNDGFKDLDGFFKGFGFGFLSKDWISNFLFGRFGSSKDLVVF